jgi:hypothetical protein
MTKGKQEMTEYAIKFTALDTNGRYNIYLKECHEPENKSAAGAMFFVLRPWETKPFRSMKSAEDALKRIHERNWSSLHNVMGEGEIVELGKAARNMRKQWKKLKLS